MRRTLLIMTLGLAIAPGCGGIEQGAPGEDPGSVSAAIVAAACDPRQNISCPTGQECTADGRCTGPREETPADPAPKPKGGCSVAVGSDAASASDPALGLLALLGGLGALTRRRA